MSRFVLNKFTERQLQDFTAAPSHAVLLIGPAGIGKTTLAIDLAEKLLELPPGKFQDYPYKMQLSSIEGKAIGIEDVRSLEHFLSLKVPRRNQFNRTVIIEDAHLLTLEAQNALLKTLEEPPEASILILT